MLGKVAIDVLRRSLNDDEPAIVAALPQSFDESFAGLNRQKNGIAPHALQRFEGKTPRARTIFDQNADALPVERGEHAANHARARRYGRADHAGIAHKLRDCHPS
ncbi:hypothetical protein [Sphingobium yanoikuyae]|uniref:hypothetical protein n=1 Tax=Sphingobium yanoikuyae TaxID=13690 RepID=UPI001473119F|nr:hypothetical protein [Sphingobium yanoikuyae]